MKGFERMLVCIIAMRSMTLVMKGKRLLERVNIYSETVSLDTTVTRNGCAYGLKISRYDLDEVLNEFDRKNLAYGEILGR